jgi:hypothetical protein
LRCGWGLHGYSAVDLDALDRSLLVQSKVSGFRCPKELKFEPMSSAEERHDEDEPES